MANASSSWALLSPDGTYHKLRQPTFFVGRNGDVDLSIKSRSVDKKHAVITIQEDQRLHNLHDLDSLNGTFVNEKRIQKSKLALGDTIRFGYDLNIYRVDLCPRDNNEWTLIDENDNYNTQCCKGFNNINRNIEEPKKSHDYISKTVETYKERADSTVVQGSTLYGQPSWWGWGSSDEEIYTYPNCATVISQSSATHCTVLQQRIKRNKASIEQSHASLKRPATAKTTSITRTKTLATPPPRAASLNTTPKSTRPSTAPALTARNLQEFSSIYDMPLLGVWERVPHGSYVEGLENDSLDNDSHCSDALSFVPILPDFGELPEKPVSEKRGKTTQNMLHLDSSTSSSEYSDIDNNRRGVFLTDPPSNSPKEVRVGKPKHQPPVKIKTNDTKASSPRTEKSRPPLRRNSSASSATKESPSRVASSLNRAPSSGGSSIPSDNESRGSGQTPVTSTSDDSDGDSADKQNKLKNNKSKSLSPREVYSVDVTDRGSSNLPRVNKTALLRARNSREAIKSSARRSSPLRSRVSSKPRHRRSTPAKESHSSDSTSSASLRIWSPSGKKTAKKTSQESHSASTETPSVGSSISSSSIGDRSTQAAIDDLFQAGNPDSYELPKELQMNRNESTNRTFVLEDKNDEQVSSSPASDVPKITNTSTNNLQWATSVEDTLETLHLSLFDNDKNPQNRAAALQADRPLPWPPQTREWMTSLSNQGRSGRSTSPESFVSVPPASSPSPPSTPRSSARKLIQDRINSSSAPPHSRRQWDITEKPMEDLMLSSVHAFTVELRLASELVLSKARNLYETNYSSGAESMSAKGYSSGKQDSKIPEWKSSHAEIAGVFRNLRRVEVNLRTMDQALSYLCSSQDSQDEHKTSPPGRVGLAPRRWTEIQARARKFSWAEENRFKFPGPPSDDEEVAT